MNDHFHPSRKRPREPHNVNTELVAIYEDLASENETVRLKAALRLLQTEHNPAEVDKILKRLFRGLCSSRKAARLGFSVALTEALTKYANPGGQFSISEVLHILKEQTEPAPGSSGQESRDYLFGRLFAVEAVIKSKIVTTAGDKQIWSSLLDIVTELYKKKQWLREECGWVLKQGLLSLTKQPELLPYAHSIFTTLESAGLLKSLEGIALWITFCKLFPDAALPPVSLTRKFPFDEASRPTLLGALKGTTTVTTDEQSTQPSGASWSNKLHFAWIDIFEAKPAVPDYSSTLWDAFVSDYLFADTASDQRKLWGFLMMQHFLIILSEPGNLLNKNFLRCFSNQLAKPDRQFHVAAKKTLKVIQNAAEADGEGFVAGSLLKNIILRGYSDFDRVTKTKLVEKLLSQADHKAIQLSVVYANQSLIKPNPDTDRTAAQRRINGADYLLNVAKTYKGVTQGTSNVEAIKGIVDSLTSLGYSDKAEELSTGKIKSPEPEIDQQTREVFRARLMSVLSHMMTQSEDPSEWPGHVASYLLSIDHSISSSIMEDSMKKTIKRACKKMQKCGDHIDNSDDMKIRRAIRLMLALSIIQAFSGDADALSVLEELNVIASQITDGKGKDNGGTSAVIEIILSLIAKPSVLFRRVGKEVFSSCISMMDMDGLESMLDVLNKKENLAGQQELFDNADDVDEDIEEGEEEDSDVEVIDEDGESNSEADSGEDDDEVIEFENKLAMALGTHKIDQDLVDGMEEEDSDEEMMDDDQMEALDPVMSNMFKQRKDLSSKKENKNAKDNIVMFKTKILELLEIWGQKGPYDKLSLTVPGALLSCMQTTKSRQVADKAHGVIKTFFNNYKLSADTKTKASKSTLKLAKVELQEAHNLIVKDGSNAYLRACSQVSLLHAKVILNNGGTIEQIWDIYSKTGAVMANSEKTKVVGFVFQEWFNWLTTAKMTLAKRRQSTK